MRHSLKLAMLLAVLLSTARAQLWSEDHEVRRREGPVVTYRAALVGTTLLVEVRHAPGWHSFALDNLERARRRTGEAQPDTEVPTHITVSGGLETAGVWLQTEPQDFSDPTIFWYTWGFEGTAYLAVPVKRVSEQDSLVRIRGQTCDATACWAIEDVQIVVPPPDSSGAGALKVLELVPVWQPD